MRLGQKVMLIAWFLGFHVPPPPIGAEGEITMERDQAGDYLVLFPKFPCPVGEEPDWFVPHWALIPIDEPPEIELGPELIAVIDKYCVLMDAATGHKP